ncbi:bcl-2-like protein 1 isoform X1 [Bos indicus x Bos taurus]|uniref:bcl-2-like protein 1 isoform X1 n=1 Tax=Bos indicus x Bos taurus TaxID=30522 RepID=UPI000F7D323B|nr:bcl-2-like protein 1 isoform X1 [Bos indicus x Bos taurus]
MSQSNRELVVDFLSYKLSQKGYSWSQFSDMEENRTETPEGTESDMEIPSAINGNPSWHVADSPAVNGAIGHSRSLDARKMIPMTTVKQALREASNEFELRYQQTFSDLTSQLHITPGTAYQSFEQDLCKEVGNEDSIQESFFLAVRCSTWDLNSPTRD